MQWLRQLVAGLSLQRPGFKPGSVHVKCLETWVSTLDSLSVHDDVYKKLGLHAYRLQLFQKLTQIYYESRRLCALQILSHIKENKAFLKRVSFSNETMFHMCGTVNRHTVTV
jgi:hypothetical protein